MRTNLRFPQKISKTANACVLKPEKRNNHFSRQKVEAVFSRQKVLSWTTTKWCCFSTQCWFDQRIESGTQRWKTLSKESEKINVVWILSSERTCRLHPSLRKKIVICVKNLSRNRSPQSSIDKFWEKVKSSSFNRNFHRHLKCHQSEHLNVKKS